MGFSIILWLCHMDANGSVRGQVAAHLHHRLLPATMGGMALSRVARYAVLLACLGGYNSQMLRFPQVNCAVYLSFVSEPDGLRQNG